MVKLSAAFFHDESSITIGERGGGGGYESAIVSSEVWPKPKINNILKFHSS